MDDDAVKVILEALLGGILSGQKKLVIDSFPIENAFGGEGIRHTVKVIGPDE